MFFGTALGIDYAAKKDSSLKGGLADTILRVRSASIVKMVKLGHRPDSKVPEVHFYACWLETLVVFSQCGSVIRHV